MRTSKTGIKYTYIREYWCKKAKAWSYQAEIKRPGHPEVFRTKATREEALQEIREVVREQAMVEREARRAAADKADVNLADQKFSAVLDDFLASSQCSERYRKNATCIKSLVPEGTTIGRMRPSFYAAHIEKARKATTTHGAGYAFSSIEDQLTIMKIVVRWRADELDVFPPSFPLIGKLLAAAHKAEGGDGEWKVRRQRRLNPGELEALMRAIEDEDIAERDQWRLFIRFAIASCGRNSEIALAEWDHLSPQWKLLNLPKRKTKARKMVMFTEARDILAELEKHRDPNSKLLFPALGSPERISQRFHFIKERAGLMDFRLHDLRHEGITRLVASEKTELSNIMRMVGHSSPQMTEIYTHLRDEEIEKMTAGPGASASARALPAPIGLTDLKALLCDTGAGGIDWGAQSGIAPEVALLLNLLKQGAATGAIAPPVASVARGAA